MAAHPGIDMMSFTGSTRAGIVVAKAAADTVKRVHAGARRQVGQHHPGRRRSRRRRSPAGVRTASATAASPATRRRACSCRRQHDEAAAIAKRRPRQGQGRRSAGGTDTTIGPVVSAMQCEKIQRLIQTGIEEGATLVTGGLGRPDGLNSGYYVRPTVFADVTQRHDDRARGDLRAGAVDHAYKRRGRSRRASPTTRPMASPATSQSGDVERARRVARALRAGNVNINGAANERRRAVRRLQAVGQRPRMGPLRLRGIPRGQGRRRLGRLTAVLLATSGRIAATCGTTVIAGLVPGSIVPRTPELAEGWIPGTSPGMTPSNHALVLEHVRSRAPTCRAGSCRPRRCARRASAPAIRSSPACRTGAGTRSAWRSRRRAGRRRR